MTASPTAPTCAENAQVHTTPAAMPSVEDVARVIAENPPNRSWEDCKDSMRLVRDHTPTARAILALFAPILAEKEREIERRQAGWDKARASAKYWSGLYSDLDDATRGSQARALTAEAALREIAEQDVTEIALDPDWPRRIAAAAIRAQIAAPGAAMEAS